MKACGAESVATMYAMHEVCGVLNHCCTSKQQIKKTLPRQQS